MQPGDTLGHYTIIQKVGAGGMGMVYRAHDTKLGRDVALKILPEDLAADPQRRARFDREAQAIAALNHPHIVTIHSVEEVDGLHFLTMEFVDGQTLQDLVPDDGMTLSRFFELMLPLTDAVMAAHAKGITHRDLKPDNVMVDQAGRLRVLDFGLAKLLNTVAEANDATLAASNHATQAGLILGTAAYMSPEQAEGKPVDPRSDVFSLGIIMYEVATGNRPFVGDSHISTITSILRDDPPPVVELKPELPRQLSRIIRRCLEKDPGRRYESARVLHYDLESLRDEVISSPAISGIRPAITARRARRFPWVSALLGAIVVITLLGAWLLRPDRTAQTAAVASAEASHDTAGKQLPSIVVFPFENLGLPEESYFAAGVTEEITSRLAMVDGLAVMSRTSAVQYDRTGKTMQQIADELGVDYVLEGTVRWEKSSDGPSRVRVTPQLIRAGDDTHLWASNYDRSMAEIFKVQSEIASEVVEKLGLTLLKPTQDALQEAPTGNLDAYHAYLRAQEILDGIVFTQGSWELAVELLNRALDLDPEFHLAYVALARAHAGFCHFEWDRTEERLARAKAAADKALVLAPKDPDTYKAQGYYYYWGLKDYDRALASLQKAEEGRPHDAEILAVTGYVLRRQGQFEKALGYMERMQELDPQNPVSYYDLAETLMLLNRLTEAKTYMERSIALSPDSPLGYRGLNWIYLLEGDTASARTTLDRCPQQNDAEFRAARFNLECHARNYVAAQEVAAKLPDFQESQFELICGPLALALTQDAMGLQERAEENFLRARVILEEAVSRDPDDSYIRSALGLTYAGLGQREQAVSQSERALATFPANRDAWIRPHRVLDLARTHTMLGNADEALDLIEQLLANPAGSLSPALLRVSPIFDGLRDNPLFQALIQKRV